jgi:hypothetical protein
MIITRTVLCFVLFGTVGTSACREKLPCRECDEGGAADDNGQSQPDLPPLADLPCGGADLLTDDLNCGACGHECVLYYAGTEYEAGGCHDGVCGPGGWSSCVGEGDPWKTCSDICMAQGENCVPNGCAGLTGMMFPVLFGQGCGEFPPVATMSGGCDEPIPWMSDVEQPWHVECCCDFQ